MHLHYPDLIVLAGLFLSVLLAFGIGIKVRQHMANFWLVGFFLSSAVVFTVKFLYSTGIIIHHPHWFKVNFPIGLLRPVLIYLYVHYLLCGIKKINIRHSVHFLPFVILVIYLFPFLIQSTDYKLAVLNGVVVNKLGIIPRWYTYFQISYSVFYIIAIFFDVRKYRRKYPDPGKSQKTLLQWINYILWGGSVYLLSAMLLQILGLTQNFNYYLYEIFSVLIIILCVKLISLPGLVTEPVHEKYHKSWLSSHEMDTYFKSIHTLMVDRALYIKGDLKLKHLAHELDLPEYLVSQIINYKAGKSFRNFLNAYRVERAKEMLIMSRKQYSIEGIAREVGFNSRATFYNAFKRETNLTPTEYLNSIM